MSKLKEKLAKKACPTVEVTVDGDKYTVTGKSLNDRAKLIADARDGKGKLDTAKLDRMLLSACVSDPEDGSTMTADEWGAVPSFIVKPLMDAIYEVDGVGSKPTSPKDSSSTEN